MHWGRLIFCILLFAAIAVVGLASGTIVAVSHNLPNIDAMQPRAARSGHRDLRHQRPAHRRALRRGEPHRGAQRPHPGGHEERHRGHRRQTLLPAPRRRFHGHRPGPRRRHQGRPRRPGREHDHRAVRQERLHRRRPHPHAQAERGRAGLGARRPLVQRQDPDRVPEHRLLRRRRLRRRSGLDHLLPQAGLEGDAAAGGAARGAAQVPQRVLADHGPRGHHARAATSCSTTWPSRATSRPPRTPPPKRRSCASSRARSPRPSNPAAYFVDYVTRQLVDKYGARETFEGGLRVYTSLDMRMQDAAIAALKAKLPAAATAGAARRGRSGQRLHPRHDGEHRLQDTTSTTSPGRPRASPAPP